MELDKLELLPFLDPKLRVPMPEFDFANPPVDPVALRDALVAKMMQLGGVGLSANQVDLVARAFVMGLPGHTSIHFNPKILGQSKEKTIIKEGCLSLPGVIVALSRPAMVVVSYQDEKGETVVKELEGIGARVFQHEYDHMEGRNFMMLASPLKQKRALEKLRKKVRDGQRVTAQDVL